MHSNLSIYNTILFLSIPDFKMVGETMLELFLLILSTSNYDSLNVTQRLDIFFDYFNSTYSAFTDLNITQQTQVVNALDENDIRVSPFSCF